MRTRVSYIPKRYSKANNTSLKIHDSKQESNYIICLDTHNLYVYAKSKFLATNGFKLIDPREFDLNKCSSNNSKVCVLEIGLEYSNELHHLHN